MCFIHYKSEENSKKLCLSQLTFVGKVMLFWVMHYIRVQNFFFKTWGFLVSKDAEFNVEFKNMNLY
jgi:hypothetical protein